MAEKRVLVPGRLRRVPSQFSWVDHRLVRDGHVGRCSHEALALYLMLVTVADSKGLSYYSDRSVCNLLNMEEAELAGARKELCTSGLSAYSRPLYQVLSLDRSPRRPGPLHRDRSSEAISIGEVLRQALGDGK
jgi:hypothetical protein